MISGEKAYIVNGSIILVYGQEVKNVSNHEPLSTEQCLFYLQNPNATIEEVKAMQLTPQHVNTNDDIKELRKQAYLTESNPVMLSFIQSYELGEIEKYEALRTEWELKVKEIKERLPYI